MCWHHRPETNGAAFVRSCVPKLVRSYALKFSSGVRSFVPKFRSLFVPKFVRSTVRSCALKVRSSFVLKFWRSFVRPGVRPCRRSFVCADVRLVVYSFVPKFVRSFRSSFVCSFVLKFVRLFVVKSSTVGSEVPKFVLKL